MAKVRVLVLRAPGSNCDAEAAFAFEQAGAEAALVHINRLVRREQSLADFQIMVIPGGFTYGDDIAAGKVLANEMKFKLGGDIARFIEFGGLMLGICNGFQALVKAAFLPELSQSGGQTLTLTNNDSGKFECRWVHVKTNKPNPCVFTRGIDRMYLPVAHGEGKLVPMSEALSDENVVLFYTDEQGDISAGYSHNPNGSLGNVAGVCDSTGRVFGLMPHPERYIRGTQHPQWTRHGASKQGDGLKIFQNAVEWAAHL
jgi:phosphoribosylformylglycinamidine synthase subunit PurQ / glutaminase